MVSQRTVAVTLDGNVNPFIREVAKATAATKAFTSQLDTSTDRTAMLTQSLLAVGPALVPITAAAIPAVAGLTNQLGFAAVGAGVTALAFSGVGDALKTTNDYAIEPTEANLTKMRESLAELGPAGRDFVGFLQEIRPELQGLQDAAQAGIFPGAEAGISDLLTLMPQVERIVSEVAGGIGSLMAEAGEGLAGPRWAEFFDFLENEARTTLIDFGRTLGNLGEGFANLWMAFDPVSDRFSAGFLEMSRDFAAWSDGLSETQGFQEFLDYLERTGPQVRQTLGALGNALLQIVEAAAPVGSAALPVIEAIADTLAAIANSDVGPVLIGAAAGISAISRAVALYNVANGSALASLLGGGAAGGAARAAKDLPAASRAYLDFGSALDKTGPKIGAFSSTTERLRASLGGVAKIGAGAGGLAFVLSDLDEKLGLTNTAMGAMIGSVLPGWGTAIGAGVGLVMDLANQTDNAAESVKAFQKAFASSSDLESQLAVIVEMRDRIKALTSINEDMGIGFLGDDVQTLKDGLAPLEDQYAANARAAQDLRFEEAGLSAEMGRTTQIARDQVDATLALVDARNELANQALAAANSEIAYEQAISDANERISRRAELEEELSKAEDPEQRERIREELETYAATLDKTTTAGQENRSALLRLAGAWNNLDPATQAASGASQRAREEFISVAREMGATREKAEALADKYLEIPSQITTKVSLTGVGSALTAAASIGTALSRLRDKEITVTTRNQTINANGGVWDYFANGGVRRENHVAQIAPAGSMRVWAEPETGGEAYIPLSPAKRPRSRAIAEQTIGMLGGSVEWFANGGVKLWGRYDDFSELDKSSKLDLARQQQRIRDLENSLSEKETYGKGKNKKKRLALRGLDRRVVQMELREARSELTQMKRENAQLKFYGTEEQEKARKDAEEAAVSAAEEIVRNAAERRTSAKNDAAKTFNIDTSMSAASVDRNLSRLLADSETFLGLLGDLKAKGASPWLLQQLVDAGPTRGAIRLARQYNTDQAALDSINKRASQIDQYTNDYASLVGKESFLTASPAGAGVNPTKTFVIKALDKTEVSAEVARTIYHINAAEAAGANI